MTLWQKFKFAELEQVMQQDDESFIIFRNKIRVDRKDQNLKQVIKSRFINKNDPTYPNNILHIFVENMPVKIYNDNQLKKIS